MPRRTTINSVDGLYFKWLYNLVGNQGRSYLKLCKVLHDKDYRWFVPNDDNRCEDGLSLRDLFIEENRLDESHTEVRYFLKGTCTMFELLVALARRINLIMDEVNSTDDNTSKWFWELLHNLGLDKFPDNSSRDTRLDPVQEAEIDDILEKVLDRTYDFDGRGSLFPLKKRHPKDMAKVEIWYQMMLWLDENYG
jgi:hypothetical protein